MQYGADPKVPTVVGISGSREVWRKLSFQDQSQINFDGNSFTKILFGLDLLRTW